MKDFHELIDELEKLSFLPGEIHLRGQLLKKELRKLVNDFKATYVDATGENPWEVRDK